MTLNKTSEQLFVDNYAVAELISKRLRMSMERLAQLFPLADTQIDKLNDDNQESLDAFLKRFEQLEDIIENRLFRGLAVLEQEDILEKSKRDLVNLMEKFGVLESADQWASLSTLRNKLTHEYPRTPAKQAERINEVFKQAPIMLTVLERIKDHALKKELAALNV